MFEGQGRIKDAVFPNFVICGAPKAGTSSLHAWLADHPEALGSKEKETYFCVDLSSHMYRPGANVANGLDGYAHYFDLRSKVNPKILLESTPSYLYSETALRYVPDLPSAPRCLFVVREPSEQIYSLFRYFQSNWSWIPSSMRFSEYLSVLRQPIDTQQFRGNELAQNALGNARYVEHLLPWRDRLGPERIMVTTFDRLTHDPKRLTQEVSAWLGLDPEFYESYCFLWENETYAVRSRALQRVNVSIRARLPKGAAYRALRGFYRRYNTRPPEKPDAEDRFLIERLAREYTQANARLREEFNLDLLGWA